MLEAVEQLPLAQFLRRDIYAYPLVNALHVLSLGVLVTTALLMDFRVLGLGKKVALDATIETLRPLAIGALLAAALTGFLLFSVQPDNYAGNPVFITKLVLIGLALANAGFFVFGRWYAAPHTHKARLSAALSILLWIAVLLAGRAIAFFGGD
ncbi:hypothetical protein [Pelagibacterium sp. H642]|uniref:hypothetical protein n=1 Tax=Pelagibacterium sp. H642 TaxID=1881069 RepID=UPI0028169DA6|nr:hypothetical protein [Pelagibacterium sp. H642]WMT92263.1 hypothetical protein NO934_08405 [Pelagibacterium sp. H642]